MKNDDGSISIVVDKNFLSARRNSGLFDFREKNLAWEHFTLDRAEFELTSEYIPSFVQTFEKRSEKVPELDKIPKVSIVIPMFNAADFIEECLLGVFKQTFTDYEIITVDDCSTDRSAEIVESMFERFDGRLKLIRLTKNSGNPGTPRNVGLNAATGKYVFFLDSDDLLLENALDILFGIAEKHNADLLDNGRYYFFWRRDDNIESKLINNKNIKEQIFEQCDMEKHVRDFSNRRFWITPWCKFLRREFLVENRIAFPATYAIEDATFTFQCIICAKIFVRIPDVFYMYNLRPSSITKTRRPLSERITRHIETIEVVFKVLGSFMDRTDFFSNHPESRYLVIKHFFEYHVNCGFAGLRSHYENNSEIAIHNITYKFIARGVNFSDELIAIMLVFANSDRRAQIAERDQRIKELRAELDQLKATKNPAE